MSNNLQSSWHLEHQEAKKTGGEESGGRGGEGREEGRQVGKERGRERAPSALSEHALAGRQRLSYPLRTLVETVLVSKKSNNTAGHLHRGLLGR